MSIENLTNISTIQFFHIFILFPSEKKTNRRIRMHKTQLQITTQPYQLHKNNKNQNN